MSAYKLDVSGEVCPIPLYETQKKMDSLQVGETLTITTNFTRSVRSIMDWSNRRGYDLTVSEAERGYWQITITKT